MPTRWIIDNPFFNLSWYLEGKKIAIIGGGLAGSEAAYQLGKRGVRVDLFEMRPEQTSPAHKTGELAELVCSNSFKSVDISNAHGLLKSELRYLDSLNMQAADAARVPAGSALAVDRAVFSAHVESVIQSLPSVQRINQEVQNLSELQDYAFILVATGPLTSPALHENIQQHLDGSNLYFYDAIAPIVYEESIDRSIAFQANRYGKGDGLYWNCPFTEEQFSTFLEAIRSADTMPLASFEDTQYFEGCLPIEVMVERGPQTLCFGPMKPVGLEDPRTGKRAHAVLQLRQENQSGSLYNLVGCQTKMTYPAQNEVFRLVPGLEKAEFARFGSIHRNTYLNAPLYLDSKLALNKDPRIHFAGQITGVEGYTESTAMGLWAALSLFDKWREDRPSTLSVPPTTTMLGALIHYLNTADPKHFQPMNANFGLLSNYQLPKKLKKKERKAWLADNAVQEWQSFWSQAENAAIASSATHAS